MASEARFAVVQRVFEIHGWTLARIAGSHHVFTKPGQRPIVIPVHHNKVAPRYVKEIEKALREENR
jgi:predicted RNA binding protein YcfA (HicA-like mRNA interferase family)